MYDLNLYLLIIVNQRYFIIILFIFIFRLYLTIQNQTEEHSDGQTLFKRNVYFVIINNLVASLVPTKK